jgi:DNA-binding NarL/FixJ family response regulator
MKIKVLLADDQLLFVSSLKTVLETEADDIKVVGIAHNGREAVDMVERLQPDVILMDVRMPEMDGVEAVRAIKENRPDSPIIMLTTFDDDQYVYKAIKYGATGYLLKNISPVELITSIRACKEGAVLLDPSVASKLADRAQTVMQVSAENKGGAGGEAHRRLDTLSNREIEILKLLAQGLGNKQISDRLFISDSTVRNHISTIYSKLDVHSRYEAMEYATKAGLV